MKNFIKRTIDLICRKPLLVKPVVSYSFIDGETVMYNNELVLVNGI